MSEPKVLRRNATNFAYDDSTNYTNLLQIYKKFINH